MMESNADRRELNERLELIETMIAEGRRATGYWGPVLILWGVAFYLAFGWSVLDPHNRWAWPITMMTTFVLTRILHRWRRQGQPKTTIGRAIGSVWIAMVMSMAVLLLAIGYSKSAVTPNVQVAILATMLGTSNAACAILLRWKQQFACALIWWATAVVCCYGTSTYTTIGFLTASFFCWIVFGIYVTVRGSRTPEQGKVVHA